MSENVPHLYGVILAGGSGTRLWPLSTRDKPKQFLAIGSEHSLIMQTVQRLRRLMSPEKIWVVCGKKHAELLEVEASGIPPEQIIIEPAGKNTAPALALAAICLKENDPDALMAVLPADHYILSQDWDKFADDFRLAVEVAKTHRALLTFGIPPKHPATGFGYIESGETYECEGRVYYHVKAFHEKPDSKRAQEYLAKGGYYWNSGMFLWQVEVFLQELGRCHPEMGQAFAKLAESITANDFISKLDIVYQQVENVSIDYAVMEGAKCVMMVPASFAWDDVGSLTAFADILPQDSQHNVCQGEAFFLDANRNIVISQDKPIALVGVEDLVVVSAPNGVLVMPREAAQRVKDIVAYLKKIGREDLL